MRRILLGVCALVWAAPALAQGPMPKHVPDLAQIGDDLANPVVQDTVAAVVDRFAAVLLDTRVGPAARYADPRDHVRADDTLGGVIARRDPAFADKLHESTRQMVKGAGQAAGDAAAISAEIKRTSERLRALLDQTRALANAGR